MEIEAIYWLRQRESHTLLRLIDSKIDRLLLATGGCPMPTSPPSSPSRTGMRSRIRLRSWGERMVGKLGKEAFVSIAMWVGGRIANSYIVPGLLFLGGLIWAWVRGIGG